MTDHAFYLEKAIENECVSVSYAPWSETYARVISSPYSYIAGL